jgi:hypothetical protein
MDPARYGKARSKQGIPQKNGVVIHDPEGKYFHESTVSLAHLNLILVIWFQTLLSLFLF